MRRIILLLLLGAMSHAACVGAIANQFGPGYGGVAWGTPLVTLVGMLPSGDHYFSTAPGECVYTVRNDDPLFGVPREGMRVQYHFGKGLGVEYIAISVPYERREQLLGSLISLFGPYAKAVPKGTATIYAWPRDRDIAMGVRASKDPANGIL
ncbi:MAG: hypothetical protein ABI885_14620 [Gammaproteobacteria bacterium]